MRWNFSSTFLPFPATSCQFFFFKIIGNNYDRLWNIGVTNGHRYVPLVNISRSFPHSWLITGLVTRLTRQVPLVEQELLTLPEHLSSPPIFSGVRVTRSLVLCVMFCWSLFVLLYFFFWPLRCLFFDIRILITLWYLQTLHKQLVCTYIQNNTEIIIIIIIHTPIFCALSCSTLMALAGCGDVNAGTPCYNQIYTNNNFISFPVRN